MPIQLEVQGQVIVVDDKFINCSGLLTTIIEQQKQYDEQIIKLSDQVVTQQAWDIIIQYYVQNQYNPKPIKVTSHILKDVFNDKDLLLINKIDFKGQLFKQCYHAATYLQVKAFIDLLVSYLATEFYVDLRNPLDSVQRLEQKFPEVPKLTDKDIRNYQEQAPHLNM